jgi:hypothetical protein
MTTPSNPIEPFSPFLPSTYNVPEDEDRQRVFFVDKFSNFADVINDKKIGVYLQAAETLNGNKWFYKSTSITRNGYQALVYIPSFPNATTLVITSVTVPTYPISDINLQFVVSLVWGSASKPNTAVGSGDGDYFSFMAQGDSRISFTMSDTTITITTTTDLRSYSGFIIIEYIRNGV